MLMNSNTSIIPKTPENVLQNELNQINWDTISLEELLEILDKLGIGYYATIQYLLTKLKKQGNVNTLMGLIKSFGIGKKGSVKTAKQKLRDLKKQNQVSPTVLQALFVLIARHQKKFGEYPNPFEDLSFNNNQPINFKPAFAN